MCLGRVWVSVVGAITPFPAKSTALNVLPCYLGELWGYQHRYPPNLNLPFHDCIIHSQAELSECLEVERPTLSLEYLTVLLHSPWLDPTPFLTSAKLREVFEKRELVLRKEINSCHLGYGQKMSEEQDSGARKLSWEHQSVCKHIYMKRKLSDRGSHNYSKSHARSLFPHYVSLYIRAVSVRCTLNCTLKKSPAAERDIIHLLTAPVAVLQ